MAIICTVCHDKIDLQREKCSVLNDNNVMLPLNLYNTWVDPERGTGGSDSPPPLKNHKNIGYLSNTGQDPLKNHKASKPAFDFGPSTAHQRITV